MRKNKLINRILLIIMCLGLFFTEMSLFANGAFALGGNIIGLSNVQRANAGIAPLAFNTQLVAAASAKAAHMCVNNYWDHTAPDGTTGWYFMKQAGYNYTRAGENLAKGFGDDQSVVAGWMASAGHRANILQPAFTESGVGSYQCGSTVYDTIVVAMYGARASQPAPTAPAPAPAPKPVASAPAPKSTAPVAATNVPTPQPVQEPVTTTITVTATVPAAPAKKVLDVESLINHELTDDAYTEYAQTFIQEELVLYF